MYWLYFILFLLLVVLATLSLTLAGRAYDRKGTVKHILVSVFCAVSAVVLLHLCRDAYVTYVIDKYNYGEFEVIGKTIDGCVVSSRYRLIPTDYD